MKKNITNITIQKTLMIRYEVNIEVMNIISYNHFISKFSSEIYDFKQYCVNNLKLLFIFLFIF